MAEFKRVPVPKPEKPEKMEYRVKVNARPEVVMDGGALIALKEEDSGEKSVGVLPMGQLSPYEAMAMISALAEYMIDAMTRGMDDKEKISFHDDLNKTFGALLMKMFPDAGNEIDQEIWDKAFELVLEKREQESINEMLGTAE